MLRHAAVATVLVALCAVGFGRALTADFVALDDDIYVTANPSVRQGLSLAGLGQAFGRPVGSIWQPLTMLSLMLDAEIWGLDPFGFHLTNLLLHLLCAWSLYWLLWRTTGSLWRSAAVAVLFAIHPLRVESVAWVTERKDVLSGLFFLLCLLAWRGYCLRPQAWRYASVVALFVAGLLSKQILVSLPLLLLLLDVWPLGRTTAVPAAVAAGASPPPGWRRLILEKLPLLGLGLGFGLLALGLVGASGSAASLEQLSIGARLGNAAVAYVGYLIHWFWPVDLVVLYPHPGEDLALGQVLLSLGLLVALSGLAVWQARRRPYLLVGWAWYLVALLPVSGLAQAGSHAMADRFTYLPQIGTTIALVWLVADLTATWLSAGVRRLLLAGLAVLAIGSFGALSFAQSGVWRDTETLLRHAIRCGAEHHIVYNNLGLALLDRGDRAGARRAFDRAIELKPDDAKAHLNLGLLAVAEGRPERARALFEAALRLDPESTEAHENLAIALYGQGDAAGAWSQVIESLRRGGSPHPGFLQALSRLLPPPPEAERLLGRPSKPLDTR